MITVLIPTHHHPLLLPFALGSVQKQTYPDIEILIVGDGVTGDTREVVYQAMREDDRVRFIDIPVKGERHGETYRHQALQSARGRLVAYQSDDDLWSIDHLEYLNSTLRDADFAHTTAIEVTPTGERKHLHARLQDTGFRKRMLVGENFLPLSCVGHTLDAYRDLPDGWRTTPPGEYVDLHMWQQFLREPLRFRTGEQSTVLHFPSNQRREWTMQQRVEELRQNWSWTE